MSQNVHSHGFPFLFSFFSVQFGLLCFVFHFPVMRVLFIPYLPADGGIRVLKSFVSNSFFCYLLAKVFVVFFALSQLDLYFFFISLLSPDAVGVTG